MSALTPEQIQEGKRLVEGAQESWRNPLVKVDGWRAIQADLSTWLFTHAADLVATAESVDSLRAQLTAREQENARYRRIAQLIGRIYFYGNFRAETPNEFQLENLLCEVGCRYKSEQEVFADPLAALAPSQPPQTTAENTGGSK